MPARTAVAFRGEVVGATTPRFKDAAISFVAKSGPVVVNPPAIKSGTARFRSFVGVAFIKAQKHKHQWPPGKWEPK